MVAGSATSREFVFHPFGRSHIWQALDTFAGWMLLPDTTLGAVKIGAVFALAAAVIVILIIQGRRSDSLSAPGLSAGIPVMVKLLTLFIVLYGSFLLVSISFFDANTPLDDRILSPVFGAAVVIVLYCASVVWQTSKAKPILRVALAAASLLFLPPYLYRGAGLVSDSYRQGLGYSSPVWEQSELLARLQNLPPDTAVYSNTPAGAYFLTHRRILRLPKKVIASSGQSNESYPRQLALIRNQAETRDAVLVLLNTWPDARMRALEEELEAQLPLCLIARTTDGSMHRIKDCPD